MHVFKLSGVECPFLIVMFFVLFPPPSVTPLSVLQTTFQDAVNVGSVDGSSSSSLPRNSRNEFRQLITELHDWSPPRVTFAPSRPNQQRQAQNQLMAAVSFPVSASSSPVDNFLMRSHRDAVEPLLLSAGDDESIGTIEDDGYFFDGQVF